MAVASAKAAAARPAFLTLCLRLVLIDYKAPTSGSAGLSVDTGPASGQSSAPLGAFAPFLLGNVTAITSTTTPKNACPVKNAAMDARIEPAQAVTWNLGTQIAGCGGRRASLNVQTASRMRQMPKQNTLMRTM